MRPLEFKCTPHAVIPRATKVAVHVQRRLKSCFHTKASICRKPPDIDVHFEHGRREEVIQYLYGKYGRDRAALTATVASYRPRSTAPPPKLRTRV